MPGSGARRSVGCPSGKSPVGALVPAKAGSRRPTKIAGRQGHVSVAFSARSPSRLFSSSRDASPEPPAARHGKQVARPTGPPRSLSEAAASSRADHKRPRAKEPQGGAQSKRFSSAGQGGSMDEAEMRAKTERWREECIQEAKALWEQLNAGGQGGKEMRAPRMAEFFGGSCRRAAASATRPSCPLLHSIASCTQDA